MNALKISGAAPGKIANICYNSRNAKRHGAFVAITGAHMDGHDYIQDAVKRGARTIVAEREPEKALPSNVTLALVENSREALATIADFFYDSPSETLNVIGVTGTNGKTTVTYLIESIMESSGSPCGRIGTVGYSLLGETLPAVTTTPESLDLQKMLASLKDKGAKYCALEVSSHALSQHRVDHVHFKTAVYTNLTQDHLDYHIDMESYFLTKSMLFSKYAPEIAVINIDDPYAERLIENFNGEAIRYGLGKTAHITAEDISLAAASTKMILKTPKGSLNIHSFLPGMFNVYNVLAAAGVGLAEGLCLEEIAQGVESLKGVPGRMERVYTGHEFTALVDYAHTPDALAGAIEAARETTGGKVITLFGCGGDRDKTKRPLMGKVAWGLSDKVVVTSDNPRTENAEEIIEDILAGITPKVINKNSLVVTPDRAEAIKKAVEMTDRKDVLLVAGKGHEDYQIIGSTKFHFDDREEVERAVKEKYGEV